MRSRHDVRVGVARDNRTVGNAGNSVGSRDRLPLREQGRGQTQ